MGQIDHTDAVSGNIYNSYTDMLCQNTQYLDTQSRLSDFVRLQIKLKEMKLLKVERHYVAYVFSYCRPSSRPIAHNVANHQFQCKIVRRTLSSINLSVN